MTQLPKYLTQWKFCPQCSAQLIVKKEEEAEHLACPSCNFMHYANPFPTATVTLLSVDQTHVLLAKRSRDPQAGTWALPGGFVDWPEDPLTAAKRELIEETGMIGDNYKIVGAWEGNYNPKLEMKTVNLHYVATAVAGQTPVAGSDVEECKWFHYRDVLDELGFKNQQQAWRAVCQMYGLDLSLDGAIGL